MVRWWHCAGGASRWLASRLRGGQRGAGPGRPRGPRPPGTATADDFREPAQVPQAWSESLGSRWSRKYVASTAWCRGVDDDSERARAACAFVLRNNGIHSVAERIDNVCQEVFIIVLPRLPQFDSGAADLRLDFGIAWKSPLPTGGGLVTGARSSCARLPTRSCPARLRAPTLSGPQQLVAMLARLDEDKRTLLDSFTRWNSSRWRDRADRRSSLKTRTPARRRQKDATHDVQVNPRR